MVDQGSVVSLHKEGSCCPAGEMQPSHTLPSLLLCGLKMTVGWVARTLLITRCKHKAPPPRPANVLRHSSPSLRLLNTQMLAMANRAGKRGLRPSHAQGILHFYSSFGSFRLPGRLHSEAWRHRTVLASAFPARNLSFSWENHRKGGSLTYVCGPSLHTPSS